MVQPTPPSQAPRLVALDGVSEQAPAAVPAISLVIPALNERPTLRPLAERIRATLDEAGHTWELLLVDDGSTDGSDATLAKLASEDPRIRPIRLSRNFGKSAALKTGLLRARGDRIITMDADLQDLPEEIPKLLQGLDDGLDFVQAWRRERQDPFTKTFPSWVFNGLCSAFSGLRLHDVNCGLKACRRRCLDGLLLDDDMHRFIPVLVHRRGFRVGEVPVHHARREFGRSKYGFTRFLRGFSDLLVVVLFPRVFASSYYLAVPMGLVLGLVSALLALRTLAWLVAGEMGLLLEGGLASMGTFGLSLSLLMMAYLNRMGFTAEQAHSARQVELLDVAEE